MEGQLRKVRMNIHPKTGESLPCPIEVDINALPAKPSVSDVNQSQPSGFYEYAPEVLSAAVASDRTIAESKRSKLYKRSKAKEQARRMVYERGLSQQDSGGGVWDFLCPEEPQVVVPSTSTFNGGTRCKGRYRFIVKGPACHGSGCC